MSARMLRVARLALVAVAVAVVLAGCSHGAPVPSQWSGSTINLYDARGRRLGYGTVSPGGAVRTFGSGGR